MSEADNEAQKLEQELQGYLTPILLGPLTRPSKRASSCTHAFASGMSSMVLGGRMSAATAML